MPGLHALVERCSAAGVVTYDAIQSSVARPVLVHVAPTGTPEATALAERAQAYARLDNHPALPVVHEAGETEDQWVFVVLDCHHGTTLSKYIAEKGPVPWPKAAHLGNEIAAALHLLHAGGIAHGRVDMDTIRRTKGDGWLLDDPFGSVANGDIRQAADDVRSLGLALERALGGLVATEVPDRFTDLVLSMLSPLSAERPSAADIHYQLAALAAPSAGTSASTAATAPRGTTETMPRDSSQLTDPRKLASARISSFPRTGLLTGLGALFALALLASAAVLLLSDDRTGSTTLGTDGASLKPSAPPAFSSSPTTATPSVASAPPRALAPFEKTRRPGELVWDGRYFWMSEPANGNVRRTSFRQPGKDVELRAGREPGALAVGDGVIWVANTRDGSVVAFDRKTRRATTTITVGGTPTGLAVAGNYLWAVDHAAGELVRVDLRNHAQIRRVKVGRHPFDVEVSRGVAWVTVSGDHRLARVETETLRVTFVRVGRRPLGLDIAFGSVWVANFDDGTWTRVNEKTGRVSQTGPSGKGPFAVSAGTARAAGGARREMVVIANSRSRNVQLLALSRGRIIGTERIFADQAKSQQRRYSVALYDKGVCSITTDDRRNAWTVGCAEFQ